MNFIVNLIVFILSLALLVVIHEFGHYITAKAFNVYVTEFSIGFGPALYSHKKEGKKLNSLLEQFLLEGIAQ